MLLLLCALALLAAWGGRDGDPTLIWEYRGAFWLSGFDFAMKVAGVGFLAAALLAWPRPRV